MSRIEELPDAHAKPTASQTTPTRPLPSTETPFPIPPKAKNQDDSITPVLPPAMDSVRSYSADEIVQMMKKTPLFMTNLDESGGGGDEGIASSHQSHTAFAPKTNLTRILA